MISKFQMLTAAEQEQAALHGLAVGAMRLKARYDNYKVPQASALRASRIIGSRALKALQGTDVASQNESRWAGYARAILNNNERQTNRRSSHSQQVAKAGYELADIVVPKSIG